MTDRDQSEQLIGMDRYAHRNIKLEGIFLPYTRKPRDELYGKFKRFVHYTSADNALKIIKTKRLWIPLRA